MTLVRITRSSSRLVLFFLLLATFSIQLTWSSSREEIFYNYMTEHSGKTGKKGKKVGKKGGKKKGKKFGKRGGGGMYGKSECESQPFDTIESVFLVDLAGESPDDVTDEEIEALEQAFLDTYNSLTTAACGLESLVVDTVEIELQVVPGLSASVGRRELRSSRTFLYRVTGRCRGCGGRRRFFDDARRRELMTNHLNSWRNARQLWGGERYKPHPKPSWTHPKFTEDKEGRYKTDKSNIHKYKPPTEAPHKSEELHVTKYKPSKKGKKVRGKKGKKGRRRKKFDGLVCDCPAPMISVFTELYNELVQDLAESGVLVNVDEVEAIIELEEVDCTEEITPFEADIIVEHEGDPSAVTMSELEALEAEFLETYNQLNALGSDLCDTLFRVVDTVEIITDGVRNRRLQGRFSWLYRTTGRCRGCGGRSRLFDDGRRRALEMFPFDSRRLQDTIETCYCPVGVDERAPTEAEFISAFNDSIQLLIDSGILTNVESVEDVTDETGGTDPGEDVNEEVPPGETFVSIGSATADASCGAGGTLGGVDVCWCFDLSGSFSDDLNTLRPAAEEIFTEVTEATSGARFGVTGYVDYSGPYPYRLFSTLSPLMSDWINAINMLSAGGGGDAPESQYDAIVGAAEGLVINNVTNDDCGWSEDLTVARLLVVTTDAPFHVPSDNPSLYQNDFNDTVEVLNRNNNIRVIGLEAGNIPELQQLADATGGTTTELSSDGSNIAEAILTAIGELPCSILPAALGCGELVVTFDPTSQVVEPGGSATFEETYFVPTSVASGTVFECEVQFSANGEVVGGHGVTITVP